MSNTMGKKAARRAFLKSIILGSASVVFFPNLLRAKKNPQTCSTTTDDIPGPFYVGSAPMRTVLTNATEPGQRLRINGTIHATNCTSPLSNVMVDVWAADTNGCYSQFGSCDPSGFNLRGRMLTDKNGRYALETIKPGKYLNGSQYRPSHVHFKFTPPGGTELITQLYFKGDSDIPTDPWASDPKAQARIIPLTVSDQILVGTFDVVLDAPVSAIEEIIGMDHESILFPNVPNPFNASTIVQYSIPVPQLVELSIYNILGNRVATLAHSVHSSGRFSDQWNGTNESGEMMPNGIYIAILRSMDGVKTMKMTLER